MNSRRVPWALVALLLVAFGLRLIALDAQSLWWDEGISLHLATSSTPELLLDRVNNIHPPLYFLLLKGWLALTGVSAFTGRYLSVLASWAQITAVFVVARRWFKPSAVWLAAGLAAISAVSVIYGQEMRVYAMLPLVYLALLGLTSAILSSGAPRPDWRPFAWLAVTTWIGLHLHYIVLFVVVYVNLWAFWALARGRRWAVLGRWVAAMAAAALASLPWLTAVVVNLTAVQAEANAGTFVTESVPGWFLVSQVWAFHLTGLANALARPEMVWLAGGTAVVLGLLTLLRLWSPAARPRTLALWSHWLLPLSSATVVWTVRSFSHPRYVAIFVPGLLLLAAFLAAPGVPVRRGWERVAGRVLSVLLVAGLLATSLWGLWHHFLDPAVAKDDMRGVARFLEETAAPDDLILIPDTDWSLPFEYDGATPIAMPQPGDAAFWDAMADWTAGVGRVFVVDYPRGTRDWQRQVPFALETAGRLAERVSFDGLQVDVYALGTAVAAPEWEPLDTRIGPLRLREAWVEQGAAANTAVGLALDWELLEPIDARAQAALRLVDPVTNRVIHTLDQPLLDRHGRPSDQWQPGDRITTFHLLPIPPGTPPLDYGVELAVYEAGPEGVRAFERLDAQGAPQGETLGLAAAVVSPAIDMNSAYLPPAETSRADQLAPGLLLVDAALGRGEAAPGQAVDVALTWQAETALEDVRPAVVFLAADGTILASDEAVPVNGRYPTSRWQPGEQVREVRRVAVPIGAEGPLTVAVRLGEVAIPIGELTVVESDFAFELPDVAMPLDVVFGDVARLVGIDGVETAVVNNQPVPLTLYWQALRSGIETDYAVFAHVLAEDGRLVGQQDGVPGSGRFPTTTWVDGAIIEDERAMAFREGYVGTAVIEVGLYDPVSGVRVVLPDGSDRFILPVELRVSAPE